MSSTTELGQFGEKLALEFLLKEGYTILTTNYRFRKTEIDIITEKDNTIAFVEVKTRSDDRLSTPEEAVNKSKKNSIIETANFYLEENRIEKECRFDIISILIKKDIPTINHIKDAFNSIF